MNNIFEFLKQAYEKQPAKMAIITRQQTYTYNELYQCSRIVAANLKQLGVKENDKVAIHATNSWEYVVLIYSNLLLGCTIVPISINCSVLELEYIVDEIKPSIIFSDELTMKQYKGYYEDCSIKVFSVTNTNGTRNQSNVDEFWKLLSKTVEAEVTCSNANDIAFIIYTSGSTGQVKGIECTHTAISFAIQAINKSIGTIKSDLVLCGLPFSFDYGLYQLFLVADVCATAFVHTSLLNVLEIFTLINQYQITGLPAVPMIFKLILESGKLDKIPLPSLRYITSTGDVLPTTIIDRLLTKLPHVKVYPMYGLTECKRVSILNPEHYREHKESVGLPLSGTKVKVVDQNGNVLPPGEAGELVVEGQHLMKGYFKDEVLTEEKFRLNKISKTMELYTGDIFRIDQEGFLYFVGRTQSFMKVKGNRVSPLIIEKQISMIQGVIDCVVLPVPDPVQGDAIFCFIRSKQLHLEKDIRREITKTLPSQYIPTYYSFVEGEFPLNKNGKVDRSVLLGKAQVIVSEVERKL